MDLQEQPHRNKKKLEITAKQIEIRNELTQLSSDLELDMENTAIQNKIKQLEDQSAELTKQEKELG